MSEKTKVSRIQIKGVEYYRDAENSLYDPKTRELVGVWNPETKTIEPFSDDEEEEKPIVVKVTRIQINKVQYFKDAENILYNKTKEPIGIWNPETKTIEPFSDDEDEEESEEEEEPYDEYYSYKDKKKEEEKEETLKNYIPAPSKVEILKKSLADEKKRFLAETDPAKQKTIKKLIQKLIDEIPKAKEFDDEEKAKKERYDFEDEITKQKNKQIALERKKIADEQKRLAAKKAKDDEAFRGLKEIGENAKKSVEKKKLEEKEQLEAKLIQYKALDEARNEFRKVAYSYDHIADDPQNPNVLRGRYVMKTTAGIQKWLEVKEMLKNLPFQDVDWYYELKADMERFLNINKEYAGLNAYNLYLEYKWQVKEPTIWETGGNNETKSGIAKRDAFVANANKDKLYMEGILRDNFTKAEREKAVETINSIKRKEREERDAKRRRYEAFMEQDKKDRKEKRRLEKEKEKEKEGKGIVDNTKLYQQVKDAADIIYDKPSAYKSGFIVKKYKEMGGTYTDDKNPKNLKRWFKEEWKDIGNKEYPVYRPTKRISFETPLTPDEIKPSNLKKQIALKQVIKGDANLPPFQEKTGGKVVSLGQAANNISENDEVYKFSNPKKVQELANKYLGKDVIIYRSINKAKKYMVYNPNTKKWVHFGQMGYEDFTKHKDPKRQKNYLTRTANIKGDWKDDKYSPNNLSRNLLW
jgi:hypothetical protein